MEINKNERCVFLLMLHLFSLYSCWILYLLNSKSGCSNVKPEPGTHPTLPTASFLLALLVSLLPLPCSSASYLFLELFLSLSATSLCPPSLPLVPILSRRFVLLFLYFFSAALTAASLTAQFLPHTNLQSSFEPIFSQSTSSQGSSHKVASI